MISFTNIDRLAIAIALDPRLQASFLTNRLAAIEEYNQSFVRRYGEKPITLNEAEQQLVSSVKAENLQQFYESLVAVLDEIVAKPVYANFSDSQSYSELYGRPAAETAA